MLGLITRLNGGLGRHLRVSNSRSLISNVFSEPPWSKVSRYPPAVIKLLHHEVGERLWPDFGGVLGWPRGVESPRS